MRMIKTVVAALAFATSAAAMAQTAMPAPLPGAPEVARVKAGNYTVDARHSQVAWSLSHMGFNATHGLFGMITGTLTLDPANPAAASVAIQIPIKSLQTSVPALIEEILKPMLLDSVRFPTATFRSTGVVASGNTARISGDLTLHGVTRPVMLDARFVGAGINPMSKKETVGFEATTSINRSDFGVGAVPSVADKVDLNISIAFERSPG